MCNACAEQASNGNESTRRLKLSEIGESYHCSIVGTCLSMRELRKIATKTGSRFHDGATGYEMHSSFVYALSRSEPVARLTKKLLDRKYKTAIARVKHVKSVDEMSLLWKAALAAGDVPGPYWAFLSHPCAGETFRGQLFGDVHMLSHLVGASNRADIRRLQMLEDERSKLADEINETQTRYRDAVSDRNRTMTKLQDIGAENGMLRATAERQAAQIEKHERGSMAKANETQMAQLQGALDSLSQASRESDHRLIQCEDDLAAIREENARLRDELHNVIMERNSLEQVLERDLNDLCNHCDKNGNATNDSDLELNKATVVYIGGLTSQMNHFRALVELANGTFIHHDGGLEGGDQRLSKLLLRGDIVMCPTDCVSHSACLKAKKLCKNTGRSFVPLRSSGLSSFVKGLREFSSRASKAAKGGDTPSAN